MKKHAQAKLKTKAKKNKISPNRFFRKVITPKTANQAMAMFFKSVDDKHNIIEISDHLYSVCLEYKDISFAQEETEMQRNIALNWVSYLNSFDENIHIQVVNASQRLNTDNYKQDFIFKNDNLTPQVTVIQNEFNNIIETNLGSEQQILQNKRYLVFSIRAENSRIAWSHFQTLIQKTETKFHEWRSSVEIVSNFERLRFLHDTFNVNTFENMGVTDIYQYIESHENMDTLYDALAPHKMALREPDMILIDNEKYLRVLYVSKLSNTLTPVLYNRITTLEDANIITTLNIQPSNSAKSIKKIEKQLSAMETERLDKVKKAMRAGYDYGIVQDAKLEDSINEITDFKNDLQHNGQKLFYNNFIIVVLADSFEKLETTSKRIIDIGAEQLIEIKTMNWQQLEGVIHAVPLGHNSIQFQRTLSSEATGINVPFNSMDLMHPKSIYYGQNLVSKNAIFCERKQLLNYGGSILGTSGSGKSFTAKNNIEQILIRYPEDNVIIIDPQREYTSMISVFDGQTIQISASSDTHINPFDVNINYGFSEESRNNPIKEKTEYLIAFIDTIVGGNGLTGVQRSIIDRCTRIVFEELENNQFSSAFKTPTMVDFYHVMQKQPDKEAQNLATILERYALGSQDIFSKETNVDIHNRLVCFDISELQASLQTTGYLVVLDHVMNRLSLNRDKGIYTWLFIDEFHILLDNEFSANYCSRIYKVARKYKGIPTVLTQNISDVLDNESGRKILSNSEFTILLKQKPLDMENLRTIFPISEEEGKYVTDSKAGQGLIVYGTNAIIPFQFRVPTNTNIYRLNETSNMVLNR